MKPFVVSTIVSLAAGTALVSPVSAQQHTGHDMAQPQQSAGQAAQQCAQEAQRHRAMGHTVPDGACKPKPEAEVEMDHGSMDRSQMNHGAMPMAEGQTGMAMPINQSGQQVPRMDHGTMTDAPARAQGMQGIDHSAMQMNSGADIPLLPPPPEAGSGPARAAIPIWGEEAMNEARQELIRETDGGKRLWIQGDRLEYRAREGTDGYLWDVQGYYGGDIDKFWFRSEGEGAFGNKVESAEVQGLWSRAIAPFFDFQAGIRQDLTGPKRTYGVVGFQGLAPYKFNILGAAFLSNTGDITARFEAELDQRITQRLILTPRVEVNLAAQDVPELSIGAGIDRIEPGIRLRYEFVREFAPYIGIAQGWKVGRSADFARAAGEDPSVTSYVVGLRFWF